MIRLNGFIYKYFLRCHFDFLNKPSWSSMWNDSGPNNCDKACFQNKDGLIRAAIEAKDIVTRQIVILAECDGTDFCNFQWEAIALGGSIFNSKAHSAYGHNIGLSMITRKEKVKVFMNGDVKIEIRNEKDKLINFVSYGK